MSAGLRQLQRGSERHKQAGPALGLSSVRRAAGGFFPHWGGVQLCFADEEMRHGAGKGLGWAIHTKGKGYPFSAPPGSESQARCGPL